MLCWAPALRIWPISCNPPFARGRLWHRNTCCLKLGSVTVNIDLWVWELEELTPAKSQTTLSVEEQARAAVRTARMATGLPAGGLDAGHSGQLCRYTRRQSGL